MLDLMTFEEFMDSPYRNAWVQEYSGLSLYIRKNQITRQGRFDVCIANMSNHDKKGNGALKQFLDQYEKDYSIFIENILNTALIPFFQKRGYTIFHNHDVPCAFKDKQDG